MDRKISLIYILVEVLLMINRIKKLLNISEAKQVGNIYHFTYISNMLLILKNNKLESTWSLDTENFSISFTRNKNFKKSNYIVKVPRECALVLDGDKLSENYRIYPIEYYYTQRGIGIHPEAKESEERISFNTQRDIENIKNYILSIILYPNEYKKTKFYRKYKWSFDELVSEIEKGYGVKVLYD